MRITAENLHEFTWQTKVNLLRKIVEASIEVDENDGDDIRAVEIILGAVIEALDLGDEDDHFGTEGWKHFMGIEI